MTQTPPPDKNICKKQLIADFNSQTENSPLVKKFVRAPNWSEMDEKKKFIRMDSWSWNQHLIDYGDNLSQKKKKKPRKASVLQSLRRRLSVTSTEKLKDHAEKFNDNNNKRLLGRGYSAGTLYLSLLTI